LAEDELLQSNFKPSKGGALAESAGVREGCVCLAFRGDDIRRSGSTGMSDLKLYPAVVSVSVVAMTSSASASD
jgi:hypothetical protein